MAHGVWYNDNYNRVSVVVAPAGNKEDRMRIEGQTELDIPLVPIEIIPVEEFGITLINPPLNATTWRWTIRLDGTFTSSRDTSIGEIAYPRFASAPFPTLLYQVIIWHVYEGGFITDGNWIGEIPISEFGIYQFDWNTKTLVGKE